MVLHINWPSPVLGSRLLTQTLILSVLKENYGFLWSSRQWGELTSDSGSGKWFIIHAVSVLSPSPVPVVPLWGGRLPRAEVWGSFCGERRNLPSPLPFTDTASNSRGLTVLTKDITRLASLSTHTLKMIALAPWKALLHMVCSVVKLVGGYGGIHGLLW